MGCCALDASTRVEHDRWSWVLDTRHLVIQETGYMNSKSLLTYEGFLTESIRVGCPATRDYGSK